MREVGLQRTDRPWKPILVASLLAHGAVLLWFDSHIRGVTAESAPAEEPADASAAGLMLAPEQVAWSGPPAAVALVDEQLLGQLLVARVGPADQSGFDAVHPLPSADVDLPGQRAADRGGGAAQGGVPSFTGRRDRDQLRSQIWNGLARYQVPHLRTAEQTSTPESLARVPDAGFDGKRSRPRRARAGAVAAQAGDPSGDGTGGQTEVDERWRDADPRLDTGPAALQFERQVGSTEPDEARPLVDRGATAVETENAGPARDADSAAAASSERDPMPLELTRASAGGDESGVRGLRAGSGASSSSPLAGRGTAATRADLAQGSGSLALRAYREDPYFRRMYQRLDSIVRYPHHLALALEQGEVVVAFTLFANGSIGDLRVLKSSGFDEFDDELTRALRAAAPFGPVPVSLRGRSDRVGVTAPYKFSSPLIR